MKERRSRESRSVSSTSKCVVCTIVRAVCVSLQRGEIQLLLQPVCYYIVLFCYVVEEKKEGEGGGVRERERETVREEEKSLKITVK